MIYRGPKETTLVHNEQMKIYATFCNNLAVASIVTGFIVPLFGGPGSVWLYLATGPTLSLGLHFLAHFAMPIYAKLTNKTLTAGVKPQPAKP